MWIFSSTSTSVTFTNLPFILVVRIVGFYSIFWLFIVPCLNFWNFIFIKYTNDYCSSIVEFTISNNHFNCVFCLLFVVNWVLNYQLTSRIDRIVSSVCYDILWLSSIFVCSRNFANISCVIFLYRTSCVLCMYWLINVCNLDCILSSISSTRCIFCNYSDCNCWSLFIIEWFCQLQYTITINCKARFFDCILDRVIIWINCNDNSNNARFAIFWNCQRIVLLQHWWFVYVFNVNDYCCCINIAIYVCYENLNCVRFSSFVIKRIYQSKNTSISIDAVMHSIIARKFNRLSILILPSNGADRTCLTFIYYEGCIMCMHWFIDI